MIIIAQLIQAETIELNITARKKTIEETREIEHDEAYNKRKKSIFEEVQVIKDGKIVTYGRAMAELKNDLFKKENKEQKIIEEKERNEAKRKMKEEMNTH